MRMLSLMRSRIEGVVFSYRSQGCIPLVRSLTAIGLRIGPDIWLCTPTSCGAHNGCPCGTPPRPALLGKVPA